MLTKNNTVSGWSFPVEFKKNGKIAEVHGHEKIRTELKVLLSTLPGERLVDSKYGCDLVQHLFSNVDASFARKIEESIVGSVKKYMNMITVSSTDINLLDETDNTVLITINYTINSTGVSDQFSMPMNLNGDKI